MELQSAGEVKTSGKTMAEQRRYRTPPIEEALCEFRFAPGDEWDLTMPGKLHTKLDNAYPGKPTQQILARVDVQLAKGKPFSVQYQHDANKVQFHSEDGTRLVGVGEDNLSVHMLRPYQSPERGEQVGWEEFRCRISTALGAYWTVAAPVGVRRVSVRYVNKIMMPKDAEVRDYLLCALPNVGGLPRSVLGLASRVEYRYEDSAHLVLSQGTALDPSGQPAVLLDLDVIWESESALDIDQALEMAQSLRDREREAFEAVITDKAREIFDAP